MYNKQSCTCDECQEMCKRPCWGTPDDIQKIIDKGYGHMLMIDWWVGGGIDGNDIENICPADIGNEGSYSALWTHSGCVFQDDMDLCKLHDLGLKPTEGKEALCGGGTPYDLHEKMAMSWNNESGRLLVEEWKKLYFVK